MNFILKLIEAIINALKKPQQINVSTEPIKIPDTPKPEPAVVPTPIHFATKDFAVLSKEYIDLWPKAVIPEKWKSEITRACKKIILHKDRYQNVEMLTSVPWEVIATLHYKESSLDFNTCLHNGDPLPGPTVQVPKGRGPFNSWEAAALDALKYDGLAGKKDWDLATTLFRCEGYNGWGYRTGSGRATTPANASPYIFSGTQFYEKGRYVKDGQFDINSVAAQPGVMAILKGLQELGEKIF